MPIAFLNMLPLGYFFLTGTAYGSYAQHLLFNFFSAAQHNL